MCGVLGGLIGHTWTFNEQLFAESLTRLSHRGPDSSCVEEVKFEHFRFILGHTRLSIIGLGRQGIQPMYYDDGNIVISFNGEIYNYKELRKDLVSLGHNFKTETDTEVLLAAWKEWSEGALEKLVGMFAFCILDKKKQELFLVRDSFGIKPIYYTASEMEIYFGSEISPLMEISCLQKTVNLKTLSSYLLNGKYDNGSETFFEGINSLPPGHLLKVTFGEHIVSELKRWWWPEINCEKNRKLEDVARDLKEIFLDSVRLHLRSDVKVGAALSGGIDSSAVVCAMRHLEPAMEIHTFTYCAKGSNVDETHWANIINSHVDAIPHYIQLDEKNLYSDIHHLISIQGEPFSSSSILAQYKVFQEAKSQGIRVMLEGQGADELFAGYNGYPHFRLRTILNQWRIFSAFSFLNHARKRANLPTVNSLNILLKTFLADNAITSVQHFQARLKGENWLAKDVGLFETKIDLKSQKLFSSLTERSLVSELREIVTGKKGLTHLLRHSDRNSMCWSVESRVPFLTAKLAEFAFSLPEEQLISSEAVTKLILREAISDFVPEKIVKRDDKIGFETPERNLLLSQPKIFSECLELSKKVHFLNHAKVERALKNFQNGRFNDSRVIWRLVNFLLWYKLQFN